MQKKKFLKKVIGAISIWVTVMAISTWCND